MGVSCLQRRGEVTTTILGLLFREGFSQKTVSWKARGNETLLTLRAKRKKIPRIYRSLTRTLSHRYPGLTVRRFASNTIRVYCGHHLTHQLFFVMPVKAPRPLPPPAAGVIKRPPGKKRVRVAIVIDDIGNDLKIARELMNLPVPVTLSIFPFAPHAREIAREALERHHTILMHLPMEPDGYPGRGKDPGPGALFVKMSSGEIRRQLITDLDRIPEVCGINNHMGSRFTCDLKGMRVVLKVLKKRGKIFLDSRTTAKSVGYALAKELGVPTAQRDVFMDNVRDVHKIRRQLGHLIALAKRRGYAIGIGHPHRATLLALRKALPRYRREGIDFVYITALVR